MELECVKYKDTMSAENAECRHPGDYCKYRSSCIIHFLGLDKKKEKDAHSEAGNDRDKQKGQDNDPA